MYINFGMETIQNCGLGLHAAVWLQAKVRECGLARVAA